MTEDAQTSALEAQPELREFPADAVQARDAQREDDRRNAAVAQARIDANLTACKLVADRLERLHREVAEKTDLELDAHTRAAALWLLSGRCLGLLRALLVQVEAGICTEAMVTGRAIHEATNVLLVFGDFDQDELLRLWLDDEGKHGYVKQGAARTAWDRFEQKLDDAMSAAGLTPDRRTKDLSEDIYDKLSRVAHSRRSACIDSVWLPGREMAYGVHPSPIRRAYYAKWAGSMTVAALNAVGDALAAFYGQGFFATEIRPLIESVEAIQKSAPLDARSIRTASGAPSR